MIPIGIVGASGFTGAELLRLAAQHPEFEVKFATGDSMAGTAIEELYPSLAAAYPGMVFDAWSAELLDSVEVVFLGLPHGASQGIVPQLVDSVRLIVDLGADFRLKTSADYLQWYGEAHTQPDLLGSFVYGLPELHRELFKTATRIATPGCYPTAASLPPHRRSSPPPSARRAPSPLTPPCRLRSVRTTPWTRRCWGAKRGSGTR